MQPPDRSSFTANSAPALDAPEPHSPPLPEPDITVIVVNYNVKDFLLQCLRSVRKAMSNIKGEILVVDNHSSDGTVDYLQPLFPEVTFIRLRENIGFARANNLAIETARGEFILFLNPDTLLQENTLEVMLGYMRAHAEVGVSGCKVLNPDGSLQLACRRSFPTPWASLCKISGLQTLFPRSKLFGQYNLTFRSDNETHFVDAVSGSFMFARHSALRQTGGFDPDFFMYGEDLDLCYRVSQAGWKIAYIHDTRLIHYKGKSTRRSSLDGIKVFYEAMELFARKHHSHSRPFLFVLRLGIFLSSLVAYARKHARSILILLADLIAVNLAMLVATKLRFGAYFGFPPYAYPAVFFALTTTTICSLLAVGEYFESRPTVRKACTGLLLNFFLLSSLTYYFKDYAFSRGVLLMTITFALFLSALIRAVTALYDKSVGKEADRRIAIVGLNEPASRIIRALQSAETRNADLIGVVASAGAPAPPVFGGLPVIGIIPELSKLIEQHRIQEVIITDDSLQRREVMELISNASPHSVMFHVALDYEEIVAARIINEVAGIEPTVPQYAIKRLRYRLAKRGFDLITALSLLTLGLPLVYLAARDFRSALGSLLQVVRGGYSMVGLYPLGEQMPAIGKIGITGLAHISKPFRLSPQVIQELNEYYVKHYSLTLDFDILLKEILRRASAT